MRLVRVVTAATLGLAALAAPSSAQPLGTFRWQLQPYCNVITLAVVRQGGEYQVDGTDDQCGAAVRASVVGRAFQNPNGTIGFGMTIVTAPNGAPVHVDATISLTTLSGTWRDSAGNNGTFIYTAGAGIPGGPRPLPSGGLAPNSVTTIQIAPAAVTNAQVAADAIQGANVANGSLTAVDILDAPRSAASTADSVSLTTTASVVTSVTIAAPTSGRIIANASGSFAGGPVGTTRRINCGLSTTSSLQGQVNTLFIDYDQIQGTFAATRGFPVAAAGSVTINLVCQEFVGETSLFGVHLTAFYLSQ